MLKRIESIRLNNVQEFKSGHNEFSAVKKTNVILPVGGGKGGIGKSMLTANIALRLSSLGHRVSVVDLDLGAANLHTWLGIPQPQKGIADFFHGRTDNLESIGVTPSFAQNLTVYGSNLEFWQKIRLYGEKKSKFITQLQNLDSDYILLDLGAGTHVHTLDFFTCSDTGLIVITPEPTSIENAYVFMKNAMFRKVRNACNALNVSKITENKILEQISAFSPQTTPFQELLRLQNENVEHISEIIRQVQTTHLGIIVNQARTSSDRDLGESMSMICRRYFGFDAHFIGPMRYDDFIWKSVRACKPLMVDYPNGVGATNITHLVRAILAQFEPLRKIDETLNAS